MTDTFSNKQNSLAAYEKLLAPYREKFAARPALSMLQSTVALPAELLQLFMLHYSAFGISMTHPVEGWIRRAGERCNDTGYSALGEALIKHARHEAGHHRLMVADLWSLADAWNAEHAKKINPVALSRQKLASSLTRDQQFERAWSAQQRKIAPHHTRISRPAPTHTPAAADPYLGAPSGRTTQPAPPPAVRDVPPPSPAKAAAAARQMQAKDTRPWRCKRCLTVQRANSLTCVACTQAR